MKAPATKTGLSNRAETHTERTRGMDEWPQPSCDECGVEMEEADGWCGVCGMCADHCERTSECVREAEASR